MTEQEYQWVEMERGMALRPSPLCGKCGREADVKAMPVGDDEIQVSIWHNGLADGGYLLQRVVDEAGNMHPLSYETSYVLNRVQGELGCGVDRTLWKAEEEEEEEDEG